MNRIIPALFAAGFADGVRKRWPEEGRVRAHGAATTGAPAPCPFTLSAFATTARLMQEACATAHRSSPRLGAGERLTALVSIDAVAADVTIARGDPDRAPTTCWR